MLFGRLALLYLSQYFLCTAWHHGTNPNRVQNRRDGIFIIIWLSSVNLVHFCVPNKEVKVSTENKLNIFISVCKLGALFSSRNFFYHPLNYIIIH